MSSPESDPNESVEISGADFAIMCDEIDSLKKQVSRLEIEAEETAYLRIRVDRLKAELAAGQVRELRYREALEEARDDVADGVNQMINCGWEKEWRIEKAKEQLAYIDYLLTLPTDNSELRAVCLMVARAVKTGGYRGDEAIVDEVIGKDMK